jgi:alkaline phosphatase
MKRIIKLTTAIAMAVAALSSCCNKQEETKAKYVFLFIGDGMGATHVAAAESYLSYKAGKLGGEKLLMSTFPYYGTATSHSANYNVTCSSAAGTAIACGEKANNGTVGINKDSVNVTSVAYCLQDEGYNIGIISSVPVNHATPASFYAHEVSRSYYYSIASQIPSTNFEFFASAGFLDYKDKKGDKEPIDQVIKAQGYTVCYGLEEFMNEAAGKEKVIFCQESNRQEDAENYVSDAKTSEDITLAQMVQLGIESLGDDEPFFIMCEGGTIDWAAHDNRTMSMITDVIDFDAAVKVAYEFYLQHKDETLIVVTADHETGGITLGCGHSGINWDKLEKQWIDSGKKNTLDYDGNRALNIECNIGWTTLGHTGGPVPVFAIGKGAEKFNGRIDNTDIKGKILGE